MIYLLLATSTICSIGSFLMTLWVYMNLPENKLSVPEAQRKAAVAKELSEEESKEKWTNLKDAFNLSGRNNGRSRIS